MKKKANPDSEETFGGSTPSRARKKQTHGFQVHFCGSGRHYAMFSDSGYGGKEGARRAARKFSAPP